MLKIFNLTKLYPGGGGISGINLEIGRAEFALLTGRTGAGKSTLIRLISLMERPDRGHIVLGNMNSEELRRRDYPIWRRHLGVIPQDLLLISEQTVFQNVALTLRGIGMSRLRAKNTALKALAKVGLSHRLQEKAQNLSGGEARRTAIARALCCEPYLALADEPLGDLDPETAKAIMKLFEKINAMGTAVLMVTHREDIIPSCSYRKLKMADGRLL
ncbi:ATP-binding cassette domain-containing protein [bacterium]|nr:ATP-binding cassette domain-containing protein [bacterium]